MPDRVVYAAHMNMAFERARTSPLPGFSAFRLFAPYRFYSCTLPQPMKMDSLHMPKRNMPSTCLSSGLTHASCLLAWTYRGTLHAFWWAAYRQSREEETVVFHTWNPKGRSSEMGEMSAIIQSNRVFPTVPSNSVLILSHFSVVVVSEPSPLFGAALYNSDTIPSYIAHAL